MIDLVRAGLDARGAELLDRQIASIELVQRMFDDQDVLLYPNRRGPQRHDAATAFPNVARELRLATVRVAGSQARGKVIVHVVAGHIFELDFRPSPRKLGDLRTIQATSLLLHADPMAPDDGAAAVQRLASLDDATRAEYETLVGDGATDLLGSDEVYAIHLDDGEYLMLGQLEDTSFVVAAIDPPRPDVRRFWPDGEPAGDYRTIREALDDLSTSTS